MVQQFAQSIDREASKAFKKVKRDIEDLKRTVEKKQDKQENVLTEMNKMKSELRIEFRNELLELQKTLNNELHSLRKEVLYYRELCEHRRFKDEPIRDSKNSSHTNIENSYTKTSVFEGGEEIDEVAQQHSNSEFSYQSVQENRTNNNYKPTPDSIDFEQIQEEKKTYLKWITVGDADLDSIDEVHIK
ncbi:MAG: hypothetical protein ACLFPL_01550 [Candidatus Nanoarchaeia archaeon]